MKAYEIKALIEKYGNIKLGEVLSIIETEIAEDLKLLPKDREIFCLEKYGGKSYKHIETLKDILKEIFGVHYEKLEGDIEIPIEIKKDIADGISRGYMGNDDDYVYLEFECNLTYDEILNLYLDTFSPKQLKEERIISKVTIIRNEFLNRIELERNKIENEEI